jgi:hypothetical protein
LAVAHRPNRCIAYLCRDATRELHARGGLDAFEQAAAELSACYEQFAAARAQRALDQLLEPAAAEAARPRPIKIPVFLQSRRGP